MRVLRMILAFVLIVGVAGCAAPGATATGTIPAPPATFTGEPDVVVTVSEAFLADLVNAQLQSVVGQTISEQTGVQVTFSDPSFDIQPDNILQLGSLLSLQVFGVDVELEMGVTAQVNITDDRLAVDILAVTVGGFPLPQELIGPQLDAYEQVIQEQLLGVLQQVERTVGLHAVGVETTEDALTIQLAR